MIVTILVALAALLAAAFWSLGPERVWSLFGPADLGPVAFETLERRSSPTDALACPSGFCAAESDIHPPIYPVDVDTLRKAFARALLTERLVTRVDINDATGTDRYVQRTEKMRFPDTVIVCYVSLGNQRSTVVIYSRSQLGKSDLGVNHARVERWLQKLSREIARLRAKP
jgi:uncharacterized protein (DUF1499 family)